jgi:hypothetical protein
MVSDDNKKHIGGKVMKKKLSEMTTKELFDRLFFLLHDSKISLKKMIRTTKQNEKRGTIQ